MSVTRWRFWGSTTIPLVLPPATLTAQFYFIFSFLDDSIVISNSSVLQLRNASLHDAGNYTCIAYNSGGRLVQKYTLDVQQKPYFNVTPTSKTYPPARTVRLDCQAKGVPKPKITWLKNGEPLPNAARIKRHPTGLVISHTFTSDSGMMRSSLCCFRLGGSFLQEYTSASQWMRLVEFGQPHSWYLHSSILLLVLLKTYNADPSTKQAYVLLGSLLKMWTLRPTASTAITEVIDVTSNTCTKVNSPQSKLRWFVL